MRQLTGLDASFLNLETPAVPLHVGSVALLDPGRDNVGYDEIRRVIQSRLDRLPPFRWKLVEVPFGIDQPYWIDDRHFDIEFHLRRIAVPPPGDYRILAEQVARIHARPLDRSRPLWEIYVIEGLASGEIAVQTKLHHAAVDGVSGAEILTILLDTEPIPAPPDEELELEGESEPPALELLARAGLNLALSPAKAMRAARHTAEALPYVGRFVRNLLPDFVMRSTDEVLHQPKLQAPATPFNAPITPHRRVAFGTVSLDRIKAIKNAAGVSVNDVVMAICAGALREYLLGHNALPDAPLQAMVPISVRTEDQMGQMGNQVAAVVALLPTHVSDPRERLQQSHDAMGVAKREGATPAGLLQDYSQFTPPAVAARAARLVSRLQWARRFRSPINVVISNIPGPRIPLYYGGAELQHLFPVSAIADGIGLNITLQSYRDSVDFGLVSCRELVPDLWDLWELLEAEVDVLAEAVGA